MGVPGNNIYLLFSATPPPIRDRPLSSSPGEPRPEEVVAGETHRVLAESSSTYDSSQLSAPLRNPIRWRLLLASRTPVPRKHNQA